jgi:hypothetical protein
MNRNIPKYEMRQCAALAAAQQEERAHTKILNSHHELQWETTMSSCNFSKHLPLSEAPVGNCGLFLSLAKLKPASSLKVRNPLGTFVRVDRPWRADADPSRINQCRAAYSCYNTNPKLRKDKKSVKKLREEDSEHQGVITKFATF